MKGFKGLLGKIGTAIATVAAASTFANAESAQAPKLDATVPSVRLDEGRPSLARTYDEDNRNWYLEVPLIPYLSTNNVEMITDAATLAGDANKLEMPEIGLDIGNGGVSFNREGIQKFIDDVSKFPSIDGNLVTRARVGFGILTRYVEVHAAAVGEGRADFKFRTISGNYAINDTSVQFDSPQTILQGLAYGDLKGQVRIDVPIRIGDFMLKPFVGGGYRHREAAQFQAILSQTVDSEDDVAYTDEKQIRSYGEGHFLNAGLKADFSKLDSEIIKPVVAVTVDNIGSKMNYSANAMGLPERDPVMVNAGLQISPLGILNLRADALDIAHDPELRVEAERSFGPLELAVFGRRNEKNLFGEKRDSVSLYVGIVSSVVNFGLYGSYDSDKQFGAGLNMSLGWHPEIR